MTQIRRRPPRVTEADWTDRVTADDDDTRDMEPTYRDGAAKNECWNDSRSWTEA